MANTEPPHGAISAQTEGKLRADRASASGDTLERRLYDALGEIGTRRKSIKPEFLEDYEALFRECPQIAARIGPGASKADVAEVSSEIIKAGISAIPDKTNRLVAEGVLAAGRFEGELVDERKRMISQTRPHGCTENSYKHRRQRALNAVVSFLTRPGRITTARKPITQLSSPTSENHHPVPQELNRLTQLAYVSSELQFRGLIGLFLADIHYELDEQHRYRTWASVIWDEVGSKFVDTYGWFINEYLFLFRRDPLKVYNEHMPPNTIATLCALCDGVLAVGPDLSDDQRTVLKLYDELWFKAWEENVREARDVCIQWFEANLFSHSSDLNWPPLPSQLVDTQSTSPLGVELVVSKIGAVERLIQSHVEYSQPFITVARRRAHKALSYYFEFDEWVPLIGGKSLRELADQYFDKTITRLASSDIVWFDSINS